MKKDYILAEGSEIDDLEFVDQYWSEVWSKRESTEIEARSRNVPKREEYRLMRSSLGALGPHARVLDGGCGMGEWSDCLSREGFDVVGVDISSSAIDRLRSISAGPRYEVGDLRHLEFPDGYFDAYFSWGAFEHFEEGLQACTREARRVLRPGGMLFITVPFQNLRHLARDSRRWARSSDELGTALDDPALRSRIRFYQWRFTRSELERELSIAGFRVETVRPVQRDEGLHRCLAIDAGMKPGSRPHRVAFRVLRRVVPRAVVSHMLMGIGEAA